MTIRATDPELHGEQQLRSDRYGEITAEVPAGRYLVSCGGVEHELVVGEHSGAFELTF